VASNLLLMCVRGRHGFRRHGRSMCVVSSFAITPVHVAASALAAQAGLVAKQARFTTSNRAMLIYIVCLPSWAFTCKNSLVFQSVWTLQPGRMRL